MIEVESRTIRKILTMFNTEREDKKPLLGMKWLRHFNWTTQSVESTTEPTDHSEKDRLITNFEKVFKTNRTIEDTEIKKQVKPGWEW